MGYMTSAGRDSVSHVRAATSPKKHVRALYDFESLDPNNLTFQKGDIIEVIDLFESSWPRGQLKGYIGHFPHNYVVSIHSSN